MRLESLSIDASDPLALARWWSSLLGGGSVVEHGPDEVSLEAEGWPPLLFLQVPEGKSSKNRYHLDIAPDDQAAEVSRALALGAVRVDIGQGELREDMTWEVLADPEGNEFCILSSRPAAPPDAARAAGGGR